MLINSLTSLMCVCVCTYRSLWDHNVISPKLVTKIDEQTEVFQYSTPSVPPLTKRDHCVLRCVCVCVYVCLVAPGVSCLLVFRHLMSPQINIAILNKLGLEWSF